MQQRCQQGEQTDTTLGSGVGDGPWKAHELRSSEVELGLPARQLPQGSEQGPGMTGSAEGTPLWLECGKGLGGSGVAASSLTRILFPSSAENSA